MDGLERVQISQVQGLGEANPGVECDGAVGGCDGAAVGVSVRSTREGRFSIWGLNPRGKAAAVVEDPVGIDLP